MKAFFGPFLCGGTFQKKPWQWGGRCSVFWSGFFSDLSGIVPCQTYGFPFDLASWASSVEGFFWTLFVCEGFFWTLFVWWDVPKKAWQCGGRCQTYGFPFHLASSASSVEGFFWTLFVCEGFFWTLFVWWDVPKKTLAVWGQVFRFLVRFFFRPFWNSALSDVWVPV